MASARIARYRGFRMAFLLATLIPLGTATAQEAEALGLRACLDAALAEGADGKILQKTLDYARAQYALSLAQASWSLSASAGESATNGFGSPGLLAENSLASGFAQSPQAGLSLSAPMTSLGFSANPYIAESPLASLVSSLPPQLASAFPSGATGAAGLSFNQVVWNGYPGGTSRAALKKSLLTLEGKELGAESGRSSIVTAVSQAYFILLAAQRDLAAKREILDQQRSLRDQINSLRGVGLADEVDTRTAEINARSAEIDELAAEDSLGIARSRLAQLIGKDRQAEFSVSEEADPALPAASADEAIAEALKRRTEIRQLELNRESTAIDRDLIKGQATPTISVNGGVNLVYQWMGSAVAGQESLGAKISLPILDSGASSRQLEANRTQDESYLIQEEQLRTSIATDVEEAFRQAIVQLKRLEVAKLAAERSDLRLRLRKAELSYGTAKNQDLLDASVESANARSGLTNAQRSAQLAVLQLRNLMGLY